MNYLYDGDGRRVYKSNGKLYWYDGGSEILAETDASGNTTSEYIFFGGKRIAQVPATGNPIFYVEDLLGTSRVITTNAGVVCYDADFYPFGGERAPYTNTCPQSYKFEGKERDTETGNDDFGARYYSNRFGRWLSADWSAIPVAVPYANLTNPQTLNLYAMVSDDPESSADLDGHCCEAALQWGEELVESGNPAGEIIGGVVIGVAVVGTLATNWDAVKDGAAKVQDFVEAHPLADANPNPYVIISEEIKNSKPSTQQPNQTGSNPNNQSTTSDPNQKPDKPYKRPSNATTQEQRDSVQNKPCSTCGATGQKNNADHKDPLVKEYYRNGTIDKDKMRSPNAVQPQCQNCSNKQGGWLSNFSKQIKKALFGS